MPDITRRHTSFWNSNTPLTSKRVRIILSHPEDAKKLAEAIRNDRHGKKSSFKISRGTQEKLEKAEIGK